MGFVTMVDDLLSVQLITLWAKEGQRDNLIYRPYSYTPFAAIRNNIHQQLPVYLFTCFIVDLNQIKKQVDENEPGTTKYFMGTSKEDPNEIWLWEEYEDDEAYKIWKTKWDEQLAKPMRKQWIN
ncbi:hypothetical protein I314_03026 [Cryptococcus bacillisporus CA1873]|uniref:ABM domain-containing protein n=2 Tax=Cryptococcus gattii TaxID=552467 RepID=A0A0D0VNA8_CRYGA|nr:hypothetical protein I312_03017 [Cryptococcus bacillisporus CA1280]KIR63621.1 hypothetical protein I314_03026 [Cryptococcus bacillisporus CA1873]|eukprot:KIR63621.1 hypothetical protein I314_03026 [Cryptococcus gattii CA1873]